MYNELCRPRHERVLYTMSRNRAPLGITSPATSPVTTQDVVAIVPDIQRAPAFNVFKSLANLGFLTYENGAPIVTLTRKETDGTTVVKSLPLSEIVGLTPTQVKRLTEIVDPVSEARKELAKIKGKYTDEQIAEMLGLKKADATPAQPDAQPTLPGSTGDSGD